MNKLRDLTCSTVNCRLSVYLSSTARINSNCYLIENRFEMPNVSYA